MTALLLKISFTFFIIGLFNFGGGGAMISLIQDQIVNVNGWISETTFTDIIAISQTTPGPIGINCATYVGYEVMHTAGYGDVAAVFGSFTATLAVVLPSFLVFFILMKLFNRFREDPKFEAMMSTLKPATAGLIAAAALILSFSISWEGIIPNLRIIEENFPDWKSILLFVSAFIATFTFKVNPITVIVAGGILGYIFY